MSAFHLKDFLLSAFHLKAIAMLIAVPNFELLEASDCTMTEAYKLLKNMHFLDDSF